ncbi:MAG: hypothetical protein WC730_04005 [Patescibacteria group bacterium]
MKGSEYCSLLAVKQPGGWTLVRPLLGQGEHLNYQRVGKSEQDVRERWIPGRLIDFTFAAWWDVKHRPRLTHPEDRLVDINRLSILRDIASPTVLQEARNAFMLPSLRAALPNIGRFGNDNGFMEVPEGGEKFARSNAFFRAYNVIIKRDDFGVWRVKFTLTPPNEKQEEWWIMPLKDCYALETLNVPGEWIRKIGETTICVGLAHPWNPDKWPHARCACMVNYIDLR